MAWQCPRPVALMAGRVGISHLHGGYHDLNGGAKSFPESFEGQQKFFFGLVALRDVAYNSSKSYWLA